MENEEKKEEESQEATPVPDPPKKTKKKRTLFHKIVNVFLFFLLGLFVIFLLFIGFTQTSTFRELLRTNLIEIVNGEIDGKINLEKIDGTIFTSLILHNASLTYQNDTIADFRKLSIKISPFQILLKKIVVREIFLADLNLRLVEDSAGVLNIMKAFPSSPDEDTTASEFNFRIILSKLELRNANISYQKEKFVKSRARYENLNMDDFRITDLNLLLSAEADLSENKYELTVDRFNSKMNLTRFALKTFKGKFTLSESEIEVRDFMVATDSSNLRADANLKGLNVFGKINDEVLKQAFLEIDAQAENFNFGDAASYVPMLDMLKGAVKVDLNGAGNLSEFEVKKLDLVYGNTTLKTSGKMYDLYDPGRMYFSTFTAGSQLDYGDIRRLLPSFMFPVFENLAVIGIDSIRYTGSPNKFTATFGMQLRDGSLRGSAAMDMSGPEMEYDIKLETHNLDLSSFLKMPAQVNTTAEIKGRGTDIKTLDFSAKINVNNSRISNYSISRLDLNATAKHGKGLIDLTGLADSSKINFTLEADYSNPNNLTYEFAGNVEEINLGQALLPTLLTDRFSIRLRGKGRNYDPENLDANISLDITNLEIRNNSLDEIKFDLTAKSSAGRKKLIDSEIHINGLLS
ncbi:MAG: hypothetical protein AB9882_10075 [Ignavibacteriaceae bacterium]